MSNGYGMTPALAGLVLQATLTGNFSLISFSTLCVQIHVNGTPGSDGTSNPAAETNRLQITESVTGTSATLSGTGPSWTITAQAGENLTAISIWSGFETDSSAICLYTLPITPEQVAFGDIVTLNSLILNAASTGLAS